MISSEVKQGHTLKFPLVGRHFLWEDAKYCLLNHCSLSSLFFVPANDFPKYIIKYIWKFIFAGIFSTFLYVKKQIYAMDTSENVSLMLLATTILLCMLPSRPLYTKNLGFVPFAHFIIMKWFIFIFMKHYVCHKCSPIMQNKLKSYQYLSVTI